MKSSEILRNIRRETDLFLEIVVQATITIITEIFIVIGILILLFYFQPLGSLAIIIVIIAAIYFHRLFTKKITYHYGKKDKTVKLLVFKLFNNPLAL